MDDAILVEDTDTNENRSKLTGLYPLATSDGPSEDSGMGKRNKRAVSRPETAE
jgi:hypothetical protein